MREGDSVGLHCPSGVHYIINTYAIWRCGASVVPIPNELAAPEKQTILRTIALPWMISLGSKPTFASTFASASSIELGVDQLLTPLRPQREHPAGFRDINCGFLRFTSGTTGAAKGVVLSHETIRERIDAANEVLHIGPEDRIVWVLSMAYHFAVSIVAYLTYGAAVVLPANHLGPGILAAARRHRATVIYASPVHYGWLASTAAEPLPNLRLAVSTTTGLDRAVADRFHQSFGVPLTQALGIIEIGLPFINIDFAHDRPEAIGRALPAYRLRLGDVGLGEQRGEILLCGKGCLDAYYDPWRPRSEIMPDGWFHTGDIGELDDHGCLIIRGRKKDVIDVLGMKFFPQEVETVLMSHPAVESACVYSTPDRRIGAVIHAKVVLRSGNHGQPLESDLISLCKSRLAGFKVPQRIENVSELPRTASGKLLHRDASPIGGVS